MVKYKVEMTATQTKTYKIIRLLINCIIFIPFAFLYSLIRIGEIAKNIADFLFAVRFNVVAKLCVLLKVQGVSKNKNNDDNDD